jgi:thiosulfate/3-mercaptopyruvate sulfurtransferase
MKLTDSTAMLGVFVEPAWLAEKLSNHDVRVVEVDVSQAAYNQGHIPGAILWNAYTDLHHADYSPLDRSQFEHLLRNSGLTPDDTIIFYGYAASLGFWLMRAYGHDHTFVLSESRAGWQRAGLPWTTDRPEPASSAYPLKASEVTQLMSLDALQATLGSRDLLILDVRSEAEFVGERFWPSGATEGAGRPGHIPGAVHLHADLLRKADGTLKEEADLWQIFQERGVFPEHRIVTYCTIGARASEVALVLKYLLGYDDVCVFDGSWAQWGTQIETPIEI